MTPRGTGRGLRVRSGGGEGWRARGALLALGSLAAWGCPGGPIPPSPTVAVVEVIRGGMTVSRPAGLDPARVALPVRAERDAVVATAEDGRGSVRLDGGAWILLDRSTALRVDLAEATLTAGRVWVDASGAEETTVATAHGSVSAAGASLAVSLEQDGSARVYCGSGEATFRSPTGSGRLAQGESVALTGSGAPRPEPEALWDDWTGGLADPSPEVFGALSAIGRLSGRELGQVGVARAALPVRGHEVSARIEGDLAVTEVVQTFFNARSEILEAEYRVRLPAGAIVSAFAVDHGSGFADAEACSLSTTGTYEPSWSPPQTASSALAYDGPRRLRARVYPVNPGATVRVRLRYSEWLERRGGLRTYVYPMDGGADGPLLGELILQVDTSRAGAGALRAGMGASTEAGGQVVLRRSDFRPRADFYLDLVDGEASATVRQPELARAYVVEAPRTGVVGEPAEGSEQYVLLDIPTDLPQDVTAVEAEPPLELVLLVDLSGSTEPEDLELARAVVESVLRQLAPTDRVALLLADVTAHAPEGAPDGLLPASEVGAEPLLEALSRVSPGGATDLGRSLREAAGLVAGRPRGTVLYLGDGLPTTGELDATALRAVLATVLSPPRWFALGVGDGANNGLLEALFGAGAHAVRERTEASRRVMEVLAEASRPTLRGLEVDLGPTVERIYPRPPLTLPAVAGGSLRLVGRLRGALPERVVLRGELEGRAFELERTIRRESIDDGGDIRRRWGSSRLAELIDGDAGREALVELGLRFDLVTPWTTLVVGAAKGCGYSPVLGFDHDPTATPWALGGGGPWVPGLALVGQPAGWRRGARSGEPSIATTPEETWTSRLVPVAGVGAGRGGGGDESLARAASARALALGERGPRGCYDRRLTVRPDLAGRVAVAVEVDGAGGVGSASIVSSTVGDGDLERCVLTEVRGIRFPATGAARPVRVTHSFVFEVPSREIGVRQTCSDASRQALEVRRALWRERLAANAGVSGALSVWREAGNQCELSSWRARRTLLDLMLGSVGGVAQQVRLYQAFGVGSPVSSYLVRAILRRVRTPQDVAVVREALGFEVPVDWGWFSRLWREAPTPQARLALVRRWLEAIPEDVDLRLRLLSLLEETGQLAEARRLAHELRRDPLADARVRTAVGELWLRLEDEAEARRTFSEIVEHSPLDPWARRRLGDLYLAHGWADDARREYSTLARLVPGEPHVVLLLARASAAAGRLDEALRLEQRLSETVEPGVSEGAAAFARLWTAVRLARLARSSADDGAMAALVRERQRSSGALRDAPALFVALTWEHPDDWLALALRHPTDEAGEPFERAPLTGGAFGIEAFRLQEREPGSYELEVRRADEDDLRESHALLLVVSMPGTSDEQVVELPLTLTRTHRVLRLSVSPENRVTETPIPRRPGA